MPNRRNILYLLACASGWPALGWSAAPRKAAEDEAEWSVNLEGQQAPAPSGSPSDAGLPAERVLGIGGLFFRARDPKALAEWYRSHLGVTPSPTSAEGTSWHTQAGTTVFAPFPAATQIFRCSGQDVDGEFPRSRPGEDGRTTPLCGRHCDCRSRALPERPFRHNP